MRTINFLSRRILLTIGALVLTIPMLCAWTSKPDGPSASWKISKDGKEIGVKLTQDSKGQLILTARELKGDKLFVISLGKPGEELRQKSHTSRVKLQDGSMASLRIDKNGRINTNLKGIDIGPMNYLPGNDNEHSALGFWSWVGDKIADIGAGLSGAWLYLRGEVAAIDFSNGTSIIFYGTTSTIEYSGNSDFKLEPGLEEEGNIWY